MSVVNFDVTRASSKYVLNESGVIEEVLANTPAFEYNIDGSYKGLLIESASENICLQSEDINTTWAATNATITTDATTAPDGNSTADKLNDDSGGGTGLVKVEQNIIVTGGVQYTASVFLKADQLAFARLKAEDYDGLNDAFQTFGLSGSGSTGNNSGIDDSRIEKYPDGWYRCSITWTQGAADTEFRFAVFLASSLTSEQVTLDGTSSIFVWGAQVEEGGHASSYIPTTAGTVTRARDDIQKTSASTYIGQTAGTIYAEVDIQNFNSGRQYILLASESTTAFDNRVLLAVDLGADFIFQLDADDGATDIDFSTSATTGTHKLALVYESGDVRAYLDGAQVGTTSTTSWTFGDTLDEIYIGSLHSDTSDAENWIKAFAFYKRALTDTEAITLTT